jgi:hypothetical protein
MHSAVLRRANSRAHCATRFAQRTGEVWATKMLDNVRENEFIQGKYVHCITLAREFQKVGAHGGGIA